ncbi:double-strand break repair helicase AddA [Saccharibacter sp. 17.LH.SD]|uniref:double-strand break repair helicase AddA n=1 Tax=Saccharibacter sp. 17.LH.SD TaxID=2689393 RepID=UPI00351AE3DA
MIDADSERQNKQKTAIEVADDAQRLASDPCASVFVSASAGSGKTKLLIDRLLRLMLPIEGVDDEGRPTLVKGSDPARILCLTYTKAAAAEMANRLQNRLGQWVSLADEKLGEELRALNVPDTAATRAQARGLFLRVLDLPGGLRVETIHAFCQSLLRRFPLEAVLDPHFSLMEETDSLLALRQALEQELGENGDHATTLASISSFDDVVQRITGFNEKIGRLQSLLALWKQSPQHVLAAYKHLLKTGNDDTATLEREICSPPKEEFLREGLQAAWPDMSESGRRSGQVLLDCLAQPKDERRDEVFRTIFLKVSDGRPRKMNSMVGKKAQSLVPELLEALEQEAQRQWELEEQRRAQKLLVVNYALLGLAAPVLSRFYDEKKRRGVVDYNDLIARTRDLLRDPGVAWVMYKLDGGIDHLLLDEVQDTSALQWEIAGALTSDFFSGEGRHQLGQRPRTVFAVGDFKQSIYSFQGAEPEQFHAWRREFARRVNAAGLLWREPELNVSFRSVSPVLQLVDCVFKSDIAAHGLREVGRRSLTAHISARPGEGGRVEIWPLVPSKEHENEQTQDGSVISPWRAPQRNEDQRSAPQRLAEALAEWIAGKIGIPLQKGQLPLRAGDVLILVPKRSAFLRALIRALKLRRIPVVSFIRSGLTEQVAVRDLMTLCAVLLLPQDDLSLASFLTSPLGGISDDSLMDLVTLNGKKALLGADGKSLWSVLRERYSEREEWTQAWEHLSALYRRVDYDTPYTILVQALGPQGGRARLLARLGPEAAEPVDELLSAALTYESQHPPSLQGFLHWLEASQTTTRREPESDIDAVRIMTVHGSKGLQARLVILPDTTSAMDRDRDVLWRRQDGGEDLPLWVPHKNDMRTTQTDLFTGEAAEQRRAERNRLLYVALTRASDSLVVCGWEPSGRGDIADTSWYQQCWDGFSRLDNITAEPLGLGWPGDRLIFEAPVERRQNLSSLGIDVTPPITLPSWLGSAPEWQVAPAPREEALARPLTPSRPEGAEFGPLPVAKSPLDILHQKVRDDALLKDEGRQKAMQRGRLVHRLLQLLPGIPEREREDKARSWLARPAWKLLPRDVDTLCRQIMGVLAEPRLSPLFGPSSWSEQAISGTLMQGTLGRVVLGKVDRFCLQAESVWLCDYKTGRRPPREASQTPSAYLRQMAAYRAVMQQVYPEREIRCFLVWTEGPEVSELPADLLKEYERSF